MDSNFIKNYKFCKITLIFIIFICISPVSVISAQSQQIKIKTTDTENIQSGTCAMKIGSDTVQGTIENGVCTLPDTKQTETTVAPISTPTPTPGFLEQIGVPKEIARPLTEIINNLNKPIFPNNQNLSDIAPIVPVTEESKAITKSTIAIGTTLTVATAVVPILFIANSPHLFFSGLILIAGKRRRKPWGIVFDSITNNAIPFAVVKLVDAKTNEFIKDTITDVNGRFTFIADPGQYYIEVKAINYNELTKKSIVYDAEIYTGEIINIYKENINLVVKIPLTPLNTKLNIFQSFKLKFKYYLPKIVRTSVLIVFLASVYQFYFSTTTINLLIALVYFILYVYLLYNKNVYNKSFGFVYGSNSKKAIPSAFVKLIDKKTKDLVSDLVLTDPKGRFSLIADEGEYEMQVEAGSYQIQDVDGDGQAKIISPTLIGLYYKIKSKLKVGMT